MDHEVRFGQARFLAKPFDDKTLYAVLEATTDREPGAGEADATAAE